MASNTNSIFYLHMPGCGACEAGMPAIKQFARAAKRGELIQPFTVIYVDLTKFNWPKSAYEVKATPTYIMRVPRKKRVVIREGAIETFPELKEWVESHL